MNCALKGRQRVADGLGLLNCFGHSTIALEEKILRRKVDAKVKAYNELKREK
jgi:hypothetical protein